MRNSEISNEEKDIIKEIINIALAKAADAFATLAHEKVLLSSPVVHIIDSQKINEVVNDYPDYVFLVQSDIDGDLKGRALLSFRSDHISRISEVCIGNRGLFDGKYREMQTSLLHEVFNIILGSLLTQLADILKVHVYGSPPMQLKGGIHDNLQKTGKEIPDYKPVVCLINTTFVSSGRMVDMPLMLILTPNSLQKILEVIRNKEFNKPNFNQAASTMLNN